MILFSMVLGEINGKLATKALQFFFVSTDGKCSLPLGFIPTTGITGQEIVGEVLNLISIFQEQEIEIHWTSSDGFQANRDFLEKIKSVYPNFLHFFDYEHLLKNLRNALINTRIQWPGHDNPFSMRDLYDFSVTHPQFRNYFKHDVFPVDKMIIKPVIDLLNVDFIDFLKNSESTQEIKGLVSYFEFMKEFYEVFRVNENWERKEKRITELLKIIQKLDNSGLSCHLIFELNLTLKNLLILKKNYPDVELFSVFSTLIVENFFSCVRQKVYYCNLLEYSYTHNRAFMELAKKNSLDYNYPYRKTPAGKCYNNQVGISFNVKTLMAFNRMIKNYEKKENQGKGEEDKEWRERAKILVDKFRCADKRLLNRESNCKKNSNDVEIVKVRYFFFLFLFF